MELANLSKSESILIEKQSSDELKPNYSIDNVEEQMTKSLASSSLKKWEDKKSKEKDIKPLNLVRKLSHKKLTPDDKLEVKKSTPRQLWQRKDSTIKQAPDNEPESFDEMPKSLTKKSSLKKWASDDKRPQQSLSECGSISSLDKINSLKKPKSDSKLKNKNKSSNQNLPRQISPKEEIPNNNLKNEANTPIQIKPTKSSLKKWTSDNKLENKDNRSTQSLPKKISFKMQTPKHELENNDATTSQFFSRKNRPKKAIPNKKPQKKNSTPIRSLSRKIITKKTPDDDAKSKKNTAKYFLTKSSKTLDDKSKELQSLPINANLKKQTSDDKEHLEQPIFNTSRSSWVNKQSQSDLHHVDSDNEYKMPQLALSRIAFKKEVLDVVKSDNTGYETPKLTLSTVTCFKQQSQGNIL